MKILAVILCLCLFQVVCGRSGPKKAHPKEDNEVEEVEDKKVKKVSGGFSLGNCSDDNVSFNCDNNCFQTSRGYPIQYGSCLEFTTDHYGHYNWYCNCNWLTMRTCPQKGNKKCQEDCDFKYNTEHTCSYPRKGITCACGKRAEFDHKVYYYWEY